MPNICTAFYVIEGEKKELDALYETMTSLQVMEQPLVENDFGTTWLGCLVKAFYELMTEERGSLSSTMKLLNSKH